MVTPALRRFLKGHMDDCVSGPAAQGEEGTACPLALIWIGQRNLFTPWLANFSSGRSGFYVGSEQASLMKKECSKQKMIGHIEARLSQVVPTKSQQEPTKARPGAERIHSLHVSIWSTS